MQYIRQLWLEIGVVHHFKLALCSFKTYEQFLFLALKETYKNSPQAGGARLSIFELTSGFVRLCFILLYRNQALVRLSYACAACHPLWQLLRYNRRLANYQSQISLRAEWAH